MFTSRSSRDLLLGLHQLSTEAGRWGFLLPDLLEPGVDLRASH